MSGISSKPRFGNVALIAIIAIFCFVSVSTTAQAASIFEELPESVADALGTTSYTAKLLMACCVLLAVGLALAASGSDSIVLVIVVMLGFVGLLTAIQWLDAWLLIFVIIIIGLMFGNKLKEWAGSHKSGG